MGAGSTHEGISSTRSKGRSQASDLTIPLSSMVYTYAALMEDVPFANGAPNPRLTAAAMMALAHRSGCPSAARTSKRAEMWIKDRDCAGHQRRACSASRAGYSTGPLGNRDAEVSDDP